MDDCRWQAFHVAGWAIASEWMDTYVPCITFPSTAKLDSGLPSRLAGWVEGVLESDNSRRRDMEHHVFYINATTCGVMSGAKWDWFLAFLTDKLAANPKNSVAIFIQPNRASEMSCKKEKYGGPSPKNLMMTRRLALASAKPCPESRRKLSVSDTRLCPCLSFSCSLSLDRNLSLITAAAAYCFQSPIRPSPT
jgi:hypothetical protein